MQKQLVLRLSLLSVSAVAVLMAGCASVAVTDDTIQSNTAAVLGINQNDFTVSDRIDSGMRTDYSVKTRTGRQYSCYVTGTVSLTGRNVSTPVCEPANARTPRPAPANGGKSCNALLRAAGNC